MMSDYPAYIFLGKKLLPPILEQERLEIPRLGELSCIGLRGRLPAAWNFCNWTRQRRALLEYLETLEYARLGL